MCWHRTIVGTLLLQLLLEIMKTDFKAYISIYSIYTCCDIAAGNIHLKKKNLKSTPVANVQWSSTAATHQSCFNITEANQWESQVDRLVCSFMCPAVAWRPVRAAASHHLNTRSFFFFLKTDGRMGVNSERPC